MLCSVFQSRKDTKMTLQIMQKRVEDHMWFIEKQKQSGIIEQVKAVALYGDKVQREQSLSNNVKFAI